MAAESVGQIGLDLVVNKNGFQREMSGIQSFAAKAGKALAAAFAVKKLADFGKQALDLGSDLTEVQNVVDVTFPTMTKQVDDFAKSAAASFGLSETMAKKYTGTFGAMAKAFGFGEQSAYEMSSALTGLAGDVASFYNISQDEAYTKLKSVFTGETETLKDLGIVMTQNALDAYAMANGISKTTNEMSEAEKVALRFQFVSEKLSLAQGDFARTSDNWANQVRLLKLQFQSFMATVGQGLINLFNPVLKIINRLMERLLTLGNAFKSFTELITGKKSSSGSGIASEAAGIADVSNGFEDAAGNAGDLGDATEDAGKKAKKAAKDMQAVFGFDQINKLSDPSSEDSDDDSSKDSGSGIGDAIQGAAVDMGELADGESLLSKMAKDILDRFKELADLFSKGFKASFREEGLERIKNALDRIGKTLREIFTDEDVVSSFNRMLDKIAYALGQFAGSIGTIGLGLGVFLTESIANGLERQKGRIKRALVTIFDSVGDIAESGGNIAQNIADVFYDVMTSEGAIRIGSSIVSSVLSAGGGALELGFKLARDVAKGYEKYVEKVKLNYTIAVTGTLDAIAPVFETIEKTINKLSDTLNEVYDNHIRPVIEALFEAWSRVANAFFKGYNEHILPVLETLGEKFTTLYEEHARPMIESLGNFIGKLADAFKLWLEAMTPVFEWMAENIAPILAPIIELLGTVLIEAIGIIIDLLKGLLDILSGIIDFIVGVFTGDWELAWQGIKDVFITIWTMISDYAQFILDQIKAIWSGVSDFFTELFRVAWEGIQIVWSGVVEWFRNIWEEICDVFSSVGDWFGDRFQEAYEAIESAFSNIPSFFSGIWDQIKSTFSEIGTMVGEAVGGAFKNIVNSVLSFVENTLNNGIEMINSAVSFVNSLPGISMGYMNYVNLPRLAQGGYVKANTPQLAMIGDNKHYGEIVAPENKMLAMAREAAELANNGGSNAETVALLRALLDAILSLNLTIDGEEITQIIVDRINKRTIRTGESQILI
ncbi:phage tail protein [Enterococcus sp. AZ109]|uniref:phage tail protein n=1 Tax=Enterococcus sp. AZ109 TaxID=2774634 RepID=UPI003F1EF7DB